VSGTGVELLPAGPDGTEDDAALVVVRPEPVSPARAR
jgi:hypothetical protein